MNWSTLESASTDELITWAETQAWCRAMSACMQDSEWHAEGDVWTHTKRVLNQLTRLDEWRGLPETERTILRFTALLHDIAKPLTTEVNPETGRVTSPKHAVKGEHVARAILRDLECDLATREQISRMVRYHGRPVFLLEKEDPTTEVVKLSWLVNNRLLSLFALADSRGRDTDSLSRPEENLHLWKMVAEEANCYDQPFPFANEQAKFLFYRATMPNLHYVPHEDYRCQVTLMSGLPGSGKDTWLQQNRPNLPVVSLDELRDELDVLPTDNQGQIVQLARERCRELLRAKTSFAFNATNTMRTMRKRWIDLFADYGARIEIVYLEPNWKELLHQNKQRPDAVPEKVIRRLAERCEPPTPDEGHVVRLYDR